MTPVGPVKSQNPSRVKAGEERETAAQVREVHSGQLCKEGETQAKKSRWPLEPGDEGRHMNLQSPLGWMQPYQHQDLSPEQIHFDSSELRTVT